MARGEGSGDGKGEGDCGDLCLLILAFFLPPVAVLMKAGCGAGMVTIKFKVSRQVLTNALNQILSVSC